MEGHSEEDDDVSFTTPPQSPVPSPTSQQSFPGLTGSYCPDRQQSVLIGTHSQDPQQSVITGIHSQDPQQSMITGIHSQDPQQSVITGTHSQDPQQSVITGTHSQDPQQSVITGTHSQDPQQSMIAGIHSQDPQQSVITGIHSQDPQQSVITGIHSQDPQQSVITGTHSQDPQQSVITGTHSQGPQQSVLTGTHSQDPQQSVITGTHSQDPQQSAHALKRPHAVSPEPNAVLDTAANTPLATRGRESRPDNTSNQTPRQDANAFESADHNSDPGKTKIVSSFTEPVTQIESVRRVANPSVTRDQKPSVTRDQKPSVTRDQKPSVTRDQKPSVTRDQKPSVTRDQKPSVTRDQKPSVTRDQKPSVTRDQKPSVTRDQKPSVTRDQKPNDTRDQNATTTRVASPTATRVENLTPTRVENPTSTEVENPAAPRVASPTAFSVQNPSGRFSDSSLHTSSSSDENGKLSEAAGGAPATPCATSALPGRSVAEDGYTWTSPSGRALDAGGVGFQPTSSKLEESDFVSSGQSLTNTARLRVVDGDEFESSSPSCLLVAEGSGLASSDHSGPLLSPSSAAGPNPPSRVPPGFVINEHPADTTGTQQHRGVLGPKKSKILRRKRKKSKPPSGARDSSSLADDGSDSYPKTSKSRFNLPRWRPPWTRAGDSSTDCRQTSISSGDRQTSSTPTSSSNYSLDPRGAQSAPGPYVNAVTLRPSGPDHGVQIQATLVLPQGGASYDDMSAREIDQRLTNEPENTPLHAALSRTLLTRTLPHAERRMDLVSVALCLRPGDPVLCGRAGESLHRMLLTHTLAQAPAPDALWAVVGAAWRVITVSAREGREEWVSQHCYTLTLAVCTLLCCHRVCPAPRDSGETISSVQKELHSFVKEGGVAKSSRLYRLLKGTDEFLQGFAAALKSPVSYHETDWDRVLKGSSGANTLTERKMKLKNASFSQLILVVFSISREMMSRARDYHVDSLLVEMQRVLTVSTPSTKLRMSDDMINKKATFDLFLVLSLTMVINTCFKEDREDVGEQTYKSPKKVTNFLVEVVKAAGAYGAKHQLPLIDEIRALAFHPSQQVRKKLKKLFEQFPLLMADIPLHFVETRLQVAGLRPHSGGSPELGSATQQQQQQRDCVWHERTWQQGGAAGSRFLQGAMCVPSRKCLESGPTSQDCGKHAAPVHRSRQHLKHLDLLLEVGGRHENFLQLLAFQCRPKPCFYVTENVNDRRLVSLLLHKREQRRWLSPSALLQAALHVARPLLFLADKGVALRDVTAFNMIYQVKEDRHGKVKDIHVKLADVGLSDTFMSRENDAYGNRDVRPQREPGPIPIRWTSWEAVFEGRFSPLSMVYAWGFVLYELCTHGCQPLTEMGGRTTADIMPLFFGRSSSVRVYQWPCLWDGVYALIRGCTELQFADRPDLASLEPSVKELLLQLDNAPNGGETWGRDESYPPISLDQRQRKHVPERGIPDIVHQLLKGDPQGYKNLRQSSWLSSSTLVNATDAELIPHDQFQVTTNQGLCTVVEEAVTTEFVQSFLPDLESARPSLPGLVEWNDPAVLTSAGTHSIHTRHYKEAAPLLEAAIRMGPGTTSSKARKLYTLVHVFHALARTVSLLHRQGWIYGDLRANNVLLLPIGEVILARIGRMVKLPSGIPSVSCRPADGQRKPHEDSTRWSAPEMLHSHMMSPASDVFALGTVLWEGLNVRDKCHKDPTAQGNPACLVPFADVKSNDIAKMVQEGVLLPPVPDYPEWLYQLICDCRNPDSQARPSSEQVQELLQQRLRHMDIHVDVERELRGATSQSVPEYLPVPNLPSRSLFGRTLGSFTRTFSFRSTKREASDNKKTRLARLFDRKRRKKTTRGSFYDLGYLHGPGGAGESHVYTDAYSPRYGSYQNGPSFSRGASLTDPAVGSAAKTGLGIASEPCYKVFSEDVFTGIYDLEGLSQYGEPPPWPSPSTLVGSATDTGSGLASEVYDELPSEDVVTDMDELEGSLRAGKKPFPSEGSHQFLRLSPLPLPLSTVLIHPRSTLPSQLRPLPPPPSSSSNTPPLAPPHLSCKPLTEPRLPPTSSKNPRQLDTEAGEEVYVDPECDSSLVKGPMLSLPRESQDSSKPPLPDRKGQRPALSPGSRQVLQTLSVTARLMAKSIPVPDSDTDEEYVRERLQALGLPRPEPPSVREILQAKPRPEPQSDTDEGYTRSRMADNERRATQSRDKAFPPSDTRDKTVTTAGNARPVKDLHQRAQTERSTISKRPPMPPPQSARVTHNTQCGGEGPSVDTVQPLRPPDEVYDNCTEVIDVNLPDTGDVYENPDVDTVQPPPPPDEIYDDCTEVIYENPPDTGDTPFCSLDSDHDAVLQSCPPSATVDQCRAHNPDSTGHAGQLSDTSGDITVQLEHRSVLQILDRFSDNTTQLGKDEESDADPDPPFNNRQEASDPRQTPGQRDSQRGISGKQGPDGLRGEETISSDTRAVTRAESAEMDDFDHDSHDYLTPMYDPSSPQPK